MQGSTISLNRSCCFVQVQSALGSVEKFGRLVKLKAFDPFKSAEKALENMNAVSEHALSEDLKVRHAASSSTSSSISSSSRLSLAWLSCIHRPHGHHSHRYPHRGLTLSRVRVDPALIQVACVC
jgi:hypothetical protein